jgi:hypothetical protein
MLRVASISFAIAVAACSTPSPPRPAPPEVCAARCTNCVMSCDHEFLLCRRWEPDLDMCVQHQLSCQRVCTTFLTQPSPVQPL